MKLAAFILSLIFLPLQAHAGEIGQCLQDYTPFDVNCTSNDVGPWQQTKTGWVCDRLD